MYTPHAYPPAEAFSPAGAATLQSNAPKQALAFLARHPRSAASPLCCVRLALRAASASTEKETASPAVLLATDMNRLLQIWLRSCRAIRIQGGGWHGAGALPRPLPGPAAWARTHPQSLLGRSGCGGQTPGSWESLPSKSAWLSPLHCSRGGAACAHQHTPSARS